MRVDRTFIAENDAERARLRALVTRLNDADLARPMPAGWTIAAILAHLAFWDQRTLLLLEQWEQSGLAAVPGGLSETDVGWINDAAKPMFLALAPRAAADLTVAIAEAVDRKVAALADDFVTKSTAPGTPISLLRAEHRREHLDEIEATLKA
jgi:hypothetical protein